MKNQRPINIDVFKYRYPPMAIASVLHRISGVIVFLLIPLFLWMLGKSLASPIHFAELQTDFANPWLRFITWVLVSSLLYHLLAGIRHLIMDMGIGESLKTARFTARLVIILAIILAILAGIWLW